MCSVVTLYLRVSQLLSFATTLCSQESHNLGLPDFPVDNLPPALTVLVRPMEGGRDERSMKVWEERSEGVGLALVCLTSQWTTRLLLFQYF